MVDSGNEMQTYTRDEVNAAALKYFEGDELPANCFTDKYALRDKEGRFYELTPHSMHRRLAREFARIESRYPNPLTEDEIFHHLAYFRYIVPQGSPMFGIGNNFQVVSLSNCAVIAGPEDTMSSIFDTGRDMANLYKRRFGVGTDLSNLRPDGAPVNNAAITSTGAWSFADLYSYITRMVGQSGRRGALMLTLDVRHPDIEKFITMKKDLTKVTGANISIKVSDDFMRAVEEDKTYTLRWPIHEPVETAKVTKEVRAKDVFDLIANTACETAEPGVLFWDTIVNNLPLACYKEFEPTTTNPCGEIPLSPNDSCRLVSIPLFSFVKNPFQDTAYFDFSKFIDVVRVAMRLSDDLVDLEIEKLTVARDLADTEDERELFNKFLLAAGRGRRTGLGTHGLADALARLGLRYDSDEGIEMIDCIYSTLKEEAYFESVNLAKQRGAFPAFDWGLEKDCAFIQRLPQNMQKDIAEFGRRNGAILTNAPTGTVSILSENCSSGIEPVFMNTYVRRRKVLDNSPYDFIDELGDKWVNYTVRHQNVEQYLRTAYLATEDGWKGAKYETTEHGALIARQQTFEEFKAEHKLPDYFVTSEDIDWMKRVKVQGTIQQHIDHSISSTINLVSTAAADDVAQIYMEAWKAGCKGVTVYRDGSRDAQVLSAVVTEEREEQPVAPLKELTPGLKMVIPPQRGLTTTGQYFKAAFRDLGGDERKVYVYVGVNEYNEVVEVFVEDTKAGKEVSAYADALGILVSLALKHGVPAEEIAYKLKGIEGASISYSGGIFKSVPDLVAKRMLVAAETSSPEIPQVPLPVVFSTGATDVPKVKMDRCDSCGKLAVPLKGRAGACPPCQECGYARCG